MPCWRFGRPSAMRLAMLMMLLGLATAAAQLDRPATPVERAAWDALASGQIHQAAVAFGEAISRDPGNARLHYGAGLAATAERREADARDEFEKALALDSRLSDARRRLGLVQYRLGELSAAIQTYETLIAETPDDRAAEAMLARWRREQQLHDRMRDTIGSHFTVSFEGPAEAVLAGEALQALDRAYWRIGAELGVFPNDPIRVVLYTAEQFRDITRSPAWAAGAYDGTIRVPMRGALADPKELDRVMAHEFTHALIRTLAPRNVPTWLNEGIAAALESPGVEWTDKYVEAARALPRG